jgi:hypothetical protein
MKLEPYLTRTYHYSGDKKPSTVKVRRCQAVNRTDFRAGQQCRNVIDYKEKFCHLHRPRPTGDIP